MLRIFPYGTEGVAQAIEAFEKEYKVTLPEKYKEFLLKYNGGNTIDSSFNVNRESSDIRAFFGFNQAEYEYNFQYWVDHSFLEEYLELNYLPIAEDSFGNYILLGIAKKNYSQIAFYNHERQKIKPLKVDFEEFLKKAKSPKVTIPSIEERTASVKAFGGNVEVTDDLIELWQEEIDEFAGREQVIVKLG